MSRFVRVVADVSGISSRKQHPSESAAVADALAYAADMNPYVDGLSIQVWDTEQRHCMQCRFSIFHGNGHDRVIVIDRRRSKRNGTTDHNHRPVS